MPGLGYFITGANGQLGTALRKKYPKARYADIAELDITDMASIESYDWTGVDILINAAAYTNVDGAESPEGKKTAKAVNAEAVANLAKLCQSKQITLVHISTDYVFDGSNDNHSETEPTSPLSVYGSSKAEGDKFAGGTPKHYILRTSWVIGEGKNFVRIMMSLAEKNISPTVVHDQVGRLTFTKTLVDAIDHLLTTEAAFGTYNVSNDGEPASWADITREIFKELGREDLTVTDVTTEKYYAGKTGIAPRPLKSTLNLAKIKAAGFKPTDWKDELKDYLKGQK